jgi:Protein of unknown function (DUF3307)
MVLPQWQFVALLAVHWLADFVLQSGWMSVNKSKRIDALALHVATYTGALLVGSGLILGVRQIVPLLVFVGVNGFLHLATDFVTSRITSRLWQQQREHDFFVVVGFDQLIHQVTLAATLWFIFR